MSVQEAFGLWPEGEQSPADKLHLRYSSIAAWFQAEGLTRPLTSTIKDEVERDRRLREYAELERFLYAKHLALNVSPDARYSLYRCPAWPVGCRPSLEPPEVRHGR
ncbi:MAG TPA: hypothetical protein VKD90_10050 [Gemmataceae bacterium]|nr:hypothetical protein [Gemmataceae bacterium]